MRTTIDIPDAMYRRLKARAAGEGRSAKALILKGVEQVLKAKPAPVGKPVTIPLVKSRRPGSIRLDNARIYDVISFP
jgi:plasmid stability protein